MTDQVRWPVVADELRGAHLPWSDYEKSGGLSSEEARRRLGMVKATRKTGQRGR